MAARSTSGFLPAGLESLPLSKGRKKKDREEKRMKGNEYFLKVSSVSDPDRYILKYTSLFNSHNSLR